MYIFTSTVIDNNCSIFNKWPTKIMYLFWALFTHNDIAIVEDCNSRGLQYIQEIVSMEITAHFLIKQV